jgi:hypothetical protein
MHSCPEAERAAYDDTFWFMHQQFLGGREDRDAIIDAIPEPPENIEELRGLEHKAIQNQRLSQTGRES